MRRGLIAMVGVAVLSFPSLALADSGDAEDWYLETMGVSRAHELARGQDVTVAVVDTGVDADHPGLQGRVRQGATVTREGIEPGGDNDPDGHGTAMAGLIAGSGAVKSVAPEAEILPVKVARGKDGSLDENLVYKGIRWAIDHDATVINVSLAGTPTADKAWKGELVRYAIDHDTVIVAAAGNRGDADTGVGEPASIPGVIAVAGVDNEGRSWKGSVSGDAVVVSAPAEELPHLSLDGEPTTESGTSGACALVSGATALIQSHYRDATSGDVVNRLIHTTSDAGPDGWDRYYGYGVVNARDALTAALAPGDDRDYYPLDLPPDRQSAAAPGTAGSGWWLAVPVGAALAAGAWWWARWRRRVTLVPPGQDVC